MLIGRKWKLVRGAEVHLECDAGASAGAVAERVFEVASGDVFREAGGEFEGAGHLRLLLGIEMGTAGFSFLDWEGAERGAASAVSREANDAETGKGQRATIREREPKVAY
jgi:hypothetical protein